MSNVRAIEEAVEALLPIELAEFRRWFAELDATAWDHQIESDAEAGRLDRLSAETLADFDRGGHRNP